MEEANGCTAIRNLNYCKPVEGQLCGKINKLDSSVHITSKTCLDLFLPLSSNNSTSHSNRKTSSTSSTNLNAQGHTPMNKWEPVKGPASSRPGGGTLGFCGTPEVNDRNDDIFPVDATAERVSVGCDTGKDGGGNSSPRLHCKSSSNHTRQASTAIRRANGLQVSFQEHNVVCEDVIMIGTGSIESFQGTVAMEVGTAHTYTSASPQGNPHPLVVTATEVTSHTSASPQDNPPPLVVFAYGGGWRRGDKQPWKHYLSRWDINLLLAGHVWKKRFYSNIGESFAGRAGFACAILSYPLVPTPFPVNVIELFTSFLLTFLFVFASLAVLGVVCEVVFFLLSFRSLLCIAWSALGQCSEIPALSLFTAILSLAQLLTLLTIVHRELYMEKHELTNPQSQPIIQNTWLLNSNTIILVVGPFFTASLAAYLYNSLHNDIATTMILPGILVTFVQYLNYRYQQMTMFPGKPGTSGHLNSHDLVAGPEGQARSIAQALRWLVDYGKLTGHFDPHSIILMGHSAGGHLVSLITLDHHYLQEVGLCPNIIKGVITLSAVHDLRTISTGLPYHVYLKPAFGTDPANWKLMSPLAHVQCHVNSIRERRDGRAKRTKIIGNAHTSESFECGETSERPESPRSSKTDSECAQFPIGSNDSVSFDSTARFRDRESIQCVQPSKHRGTDFKPRFLIISAEKDLDFMRRDATQMYRALLGSGYDTRRGLFADCNHFSMVQTFRGCEKEIAPSGGERLCWEFVEGIKVHTDKEAIRIKSDTQ